MSKMGETPIGVTLIGEGSAPGAVAAVTGGRVAVDTGDRVEVYEQRAFLAGARSVLYGLPLPPQAKATLAPDGGFIVAEGAAVRAVNADGSTRWRLPHDPWHGGNRAPRAPGFPAVSPDGKLVSVLTPTLVEDDSRAVLVYDEPHCSYGRDTLLILDAASGAIRARRPVASVASGLTQHWHPDGATLVVSCWTAWYSWSTWWLDPHTDDAAVRGGTTMREVRGSLPASAQVLTIRRAESIACQDDRDELALHDATTGDQVALFDLEELAADPDSDEFDDTYVLDSEHVLVTGKVYLQGRPPEIRHWLFAAATLQPLGRLQYPASVSRDVTPLGDGTWLTRDGGQLRHWALA
ncbi:hypothetical protein YWIDRAFT_07844 [Streptomyces sp. SceaMP-e96]|uniref:hypothetical protein n=1 Tax=unclassified Streptomyces TaxID=2593676 RepID=UPI000823F415|nr:MULTISPECIES: hypothetical protein [unclassified Streptomyces]MYT18171.1 hypothetical protein [Streptomyces sp. SID4951]SCK51567.1 hypothetical protein YWIDRAFT_07844 [Streptomyces sp. SceaMP-e96]